jgi:hypothetical protein
MNIRGKSAGRPSSSVSVSSKVFTDLINNIEDSDLLIMDSVDLLTIINQGILPNNDAIKSILVTEPFSDERKTSLKNIKDAIDKGEDVTKSTKGEDEIPQDDEEKEEDVKEDTEEKNKIKTTKTSNEKDKKLAKINLMRNLKAIDNQLVNAIGDSEAIEFLMVNRIRKIWDNVINGVINIKDINEEYNTCGRYSKVVFDRFINEYNTIEEYEAPIGFSYKVKGETIKPNLMQKLMVNRLKKNHYYGNWSGMGSGKTLSAIISSREINSHLTVIVCLNSTVNQWADDILNAYPEETGTCVYIAKDNKYDGIKFDMSKYNYLLIPYSRLSQPNEESCLKHISECNVDFIIIDEVHKAKRRGGKERKVSSRRKRLDKLINWSKKVNKDMYEMVMSGTPIINELSEAKSLLTLLTGNKFEDIKTERRTLSNALKLHQMLLIHGIRFVPKYDQELNILTSENTECLKINGDKYLETLKGIKSIDTEKLFVNDKLNSIEGFLKKGVLIYTHYTSDFIQPIREFVESKGFTTALYSDNRDNRNIELVRFRKGEADIMIASDPVNTGVDRLQEVCDTMILITLPWTNADFEQLKGRIYRQGMSSDASINIIIPQVIVTDVDGKEWSWDKQRFELIKSKKSLADCVLDGVIPSTKFYSRETLYRKSVEGLKVWKERINSEDFLFRQDSGITVDITVETQEERKMRIKSVISTFNNKGKRTEHSKFHSEIEKNPKLFFEYHKARRESMSTWNEIPYEYIAKKIKNKNRVVADFGCGENLLKTCIPDNKVISFDHVAIDETVIACDMAHTPLENESIDIAVFSLALWGSNYEDYFTEAYRLLTYDGLMYIAEPSSSYSEEERYELIEKLRQNGFTIVMQGKDMWEDRGKFFYVTLIKK